MLHHIFFKEENQEHWVVSFIPPTSQNSTQDHIQILPNHFMECKDSGCTKLSIQPCVAFYNQDFRLSLRCALYKSTDDIW